MAGLSYMGLFPLLHLYVPPSSLPYKARAFGELQAAVWIPPCLENFKIQSSIGQIEVWITPLPHDLNLLFPAFTCNCVPLGYKKSLLQLL